VWQQRQPGARYTITAPQETVSTCTWQHKITESCVHRRASPRARLSHAHPERIHRLRAELCEAPTPRALRCDGMARDCVPRALESQSHCCTARAVCTAPRLVDPDSQLFPQFRKPKHMMPPERGSPRSPPLRSPETLYDTARPPKSRHHREEEQPGRLVRAPASCRRFGSRCRRCPRTVLPRLAAARNAPPLIPELPPHAATAAAAAAGSAAGGVSSALVALGVLLLPPVGD